MAKGLWKFVDGSAVLAEGASEGDKEKFNRRLSLLLLWLCHHHCSILSPPLPNDAWNTLKKHFEHDTLAFCWQDSVEDGVQSRSFEACYYCMYDVLYVPKLSFSLFSV